MRLKFLLRPGWIGLILLVAVFSVVCFTLLAPWQFGRDQETESRNAAIANSFHAEPQPLEQVLPGQQAPDARTEWTRVDFHGHYLPGGEVLAWLRTVQGEPAIEVLTPFQLDSGQTLLVDRGYLRPVNVTRTPPYPAAPTGPVTVSARVRSDETDSDHRPTFPRDGRLWTYSVNSQVVSAGTQVPMRPGYFALDAGQPGGLNPLPLPQLETGPYFSYALQWIVFGIMAPFGVGYLVHSEVKASRTPQGQPARPAPAAPAEPEPRPRRTPRGWRGQKRSVAQAIAEEERQEEADRQQRPRPAGEQQDPDRSTEDLSAENPAAGDRQGGSQQDGSQRRTTNNS